MVRPYDVMHLTLGSYVLLGPQNLARVVALPESHIALVQMELIPCEYIFSTKYVLPEVNILFS